MTADDIWFRPSGPRREPITAVQRQKRNEEICQLGANGVPVDHIAEKYNLTTERIRQILYPRTKPAKPPTVRPSLGRSLPRPVARSGDVLHVITVRPVQRGPRRNRGIRDLDAIEAIDRLLGRLVVAGWIIDLTTSTPDATAWSWSFRPGTENSADVMAGLIDVVQAIAPSHWVQMVTQ